MAIVYLRIFLKGCQQQLKPRRDPVAHTEFQNLIEIEQQDHLHTISKIFDFLQVTLVSFHIWNKVI